MLRAFFRSAAPWERLVAKTMLRAMIRGIAPAASRDESEYLSLFMDRLERMNGYPVAIKGKLHRLSNVGERRG